MKKSIIQIAKIIGWQQLEPTPNRYYWKSPSNHASMLTSSKNWINFNPEKDPRDDYSILVWAKRDSIRIWNFGCALATFMMKPSNYELGDYFKTACIMEGIEQHER